MPLGALWEQQAGWCEQEQFWLGDVPGAMSGPQGSLGILVWDSQALWAA